MAARRPLVALNGGAAEIPVGDFISVANGGTGASTVAGALSNLGLNTAGAVSFRNRLITGTFRVNQRGYASNTSLAAAAYGHDRWRAGSGGCAYTFTQLASITGINITAGSLQQVVEGALIEGGAYVLSWLGTAVARLNVAGAAPSGAYASSPIVVTGVAAGAIVTVEWTGGTLMQPMFEPGSAPSLFEFPPPVFEYQAGRKYFRRLYDPPLQGKAASATLVNRMALSFEIPMLKKPSLIIGGTLTIYDGGGTGNITSIAADNSTADGLEIDVNVSGGLTALRPASIIKAGGGYIDVSAEV